MVAAPAAPARRAARSTPAPDVDTLVNELLGVLGDELASIAALEPIVEAEERALTRADADGVMAAAQHGEALARRLRGLADRRARIVDHLSRALAMPPRDLTLSQLALSAPDAAPRLEALRVPLRLALERTLRRTRRNAALVDRALGFVDRLAAHLTSARAFPGAATYAASGRVAGGACEARRLDRQA
jgi:hypothetical protein